MAHRRNRFFFNSASSPAGAVGFLQRQWLLSKILLNLIQLSQKDSHQSDEVI